MAMLARQITIPIVRIVRKLKNLIFTSIPLILLNGSLSAFFRAPRARWNCDASLPGQKISHSAGASRDAIKKSQITC